MTSTRTDLLCELHILRQLLRTQQHPGGSPTSIAEINRATADLRHVRALLRQLPDVDADARINLRSMPRTRAERALRKRKQLEAAQQQAVHSAYQSALPRATDNLHSWGVYEEDMGVGRDAFRREVESGACAIAQESLKDGPDWVGLIAVQQADLKAALKDWALQEGCPSWWVLEGHLFFDHQAYTQLRALNWIGKDGLSPRYLTPRDGLAPLRVVAAYSRRVIHSNRALPEQATPAESAPFRLLREVGMIRRDRRTGEPGYHQLDFSDPARPF